MNKPLKHIVSFNPLTIEDFNSDVETMHQTEWYWDGYIAPGHVSLLTSQWKAGKTTLVTGLLQQLADGKPFLGREIKPAKVLIVSEESKAQWQERLRTMPLGQNVQILSRPFLTRPTFEEWTDLIDYAVKRVAEKEINLLVIDPLATFLPSHCENDAGTLMESLLPLQRLTENGAAVLLLHHPRKEASEEGHSARGSGALLGFVDIVIELNRMGRSKMESNHRRLVGLSRRKETPTILNYLWNKETNVFSVVNDLSDADYRANWKTLLKILKARTYAASPGDLLEDWPSDSDKPTVAMMNDWLKRAFAEKKIRREGKGVKGQPFRYRVENEDDEYYDRGELPPLRGLLK